MKELDPVFYAYGVLTIFLLVMTFVILKKSLSTVNYLFSLSPLTFALVIVLNMVDYFVDLPDIVPRIPYLLATLGIFFAGVYIFEGRDLIRDYYVMSFGIIFILYSLGLAYYIETTSNPFPGGLMHLSIIFPVIISFYYYIKLRSIIPESKNAISTLILGEIVIIGGAVLRANYFFGNTSGDYIPGLGLILIGIIIVIFSFTAFSSSESSPKYTV